MTAELIRRRPVSDRVPITDEFAFPVASFEPILQRFTAPAASEHGILLTLSADPDTPPPYDLETFAFALDFSEPPPAPPDDADRLFRLILPSTEFPTWMLTLSSAPHTLFLSVNLAKSVIVEAYLQRTEQ